MPVQMTYRCILILNHVIISASLLNPIYTTSVLGTAPLNFGTRAANLRHGTPVLCRVNTYLWARVPKNSGRPSTSEIGSLGPPVWSAVPEFE